MKFKVGDHVKIVDNSTIISYYRGRIGVVENDDQYVLVKIEGIDSLVACAPEDLTLCLPEKWAIKTDRQEFFDWFNALPNVEKGANYPYSAVKNSRGILHFPEYGNDKGEELFFIHTSLQEGFELKDFDYWCRVHRPYILPTNSIPKNWCVRRTPENAEVLNAWRQHMLNVDTGNYVHGYILSDGRGYPHEIDLEKYPEITFEQWKEIPEVKGWLKEWKEKDHDTESILNEDPSKISYKPELRKIVAYKAPFDMFDGAVKKGSIFFKKDTSDNGYRLEGWAKYDIYYLPGELVEKFFEPVYEEEKMTPESIISKYRYAIAFFKAHYKGETFEPEEFENDIKKLLEDSK